MSPGDPRSSKQTRKAHLLYTKHTSLYILLTSRILMRLTARRTKGRRFFFSVEEAVDTLKLITPYFMLQ